MLTPTIISTVLALAPPTDLPPPDFSVQLDSVEFIDGGDDVQLVAYDASGEIIGSIAFWRDRGGGLHVLSDYGDGYAEVVIVDGEATIATTLDRPSWVIARRLSESGCTFTAGTVQKGSRGRLVRFQCSGRRPRVCLLRPSVR
jgi:hypothetical protein